VHPCLHNQPKKHTKNTVREPCLALQWVAHIHFSCQQQLPEQVSMYVIAQTAHTAQQCMTGWCQGSSVTVVMHCGLPGFETLSVMWLSSVGQLGAVH
jgi:hypothetical protein